MPVFRVLRYLLPCLLLAVMFNARVLAQTTFSPNLRVFDPSSTDAQTGAEPSIIVGPDNAVFVSVPDARVRLWRSLNAGANWTFLGTVDSDLGGEFGDSDLIFDGLGRLYVNDLDDLTSLISRYSNPNTMTSVTQRDSRTAGMPGEDRQWMATFGPETLYLAFHDAAAENVWVQASFDGAQTFLPPVPAITDPLLLVDTIPNTNDGRIITDKRTGAVYVAFAATTLEDTASNPPFGPHRRIIVARSFDNALTWADAVAFEGPAGTAVGNIFPAFTIDRSGNLYAVFAANLDRTLQLTPTGTLNVFLTRSTDQGKTWSVPVQVNSDVGSHVLPAAVAGCAGSVDITWYGTSTVGNPNTIDNSAQWNVFFAQTLNGLAAQPTFQQAQVSDHIVHVAQISTGGLFGSADRRLLDFFEVDLDNAGMAHTAWADTGTTTSGTAQVFYSHQTGGSSALSCTAPQTSPDVSGGGFIVAGGKANFGINAAAQGLGATGNLTYIDHSSSGFTFKSSSIASVVRHGNQATITGQGLVNGTLATSFTVSVTDNGDPGASDSFAIALGNGYQASGTLAGGNIQVRQ